MGSRTLALGLSLALVATACADHGRAASASHRQSTTTSTTTTTLDVPQIAPLRGVPTTDPAVVARPALSVKIDNRPEARPQVGLDAADVVYEELTEGGITRFLAVFQSELPNEVGPIRSVRAVDPALLTPLRGVLAYSGGTPPNVDAVEHAPVLALDETAARDAMHRVHSRAPPHNLFGTPAMLVDRAGRHARQPRPLFTYGVAKRTAAASACGHIAVAFSREYVSVYDWKPGAGWLRTSGGMPFRVASGAQIAPTNIVVLWLRDQSAEATVGHGDALVLRDGTLARGTWQRGSVSQPLRLLDRSGAGLRLAPGTTWVHLAIQDNSAVETCPAR